MRGIGGIVLGIAVFSAVCIGGIERGKGVRLGWWAGGGGE